jgi:hypothetical protein
VIQELQGLRGIAEVEYQHRFEQLAGRINQS